MITSSTSVWIVGDKVLSDVHLNRWSDGGLGVELRDVQLVFENPAHASRWLRGLADRIDRIEETGR